MNISKAQKRSEEPQDECEWVDDICKTIIYILYL